MSEKEDDQWPNIPVLISIHDTWHDRVGVGTCTDNQEDDQKQGLEVEECRLLFSPPKEG
jgi:hypothetical protein